MNKLFNRIFNNIYNDIFNNIYFGPLYFVQDIKKDESFQYEYDRFFKRAVYIEKKKMLLIYVGNFLVYKLNERLFVNLHNYELIDLKEMKDGENYILKDSLVSYSEFKDVHIKNKTLKDMYPKKKIIKTLRKYYSDQNKNKTNN